MSSIKQARMAGRIREILATLLLTEVTDPALAGLTVTEVKLDKDLEYAEVFVNALGEEGRVGEIMAGLKRANGFLRREVGKAVRTRRTPELRFHWDESFEQGRRVEEALDRLNDDDSAPVEQDSQEDEA